MLPYKNEEIFKKNVNYLTENFSNFLGAFEALQLTSRLLVSANGDYDVDIGGGQLLYGNDAKGAAERQVKNYLDAPTRYHSPLHTVKDRLQWNYVTSNSPMIQFLQEMEAQMGQPPNKDIPFNPSFDTGFLFIFGIGLGFHIQSLVKLLNFKSLVIIEPHDQLLMHNLHIMDWEKFSLSLREDGRDITFIRGENLFAQFVTAAHSKYYPFLGGSYLYVHYNMPEITDLISEISNRTEYVLGVEGWTEDQLRMFHNSAINNSKPGFYLQKNFSNGSRTKPAIVVGAGPSLDKNIETIKRYKNDAVIISSSSSLSALLANDITPNIHCALENIESLGFVLEKLSKKHDFSEISLFASFTVDERLSKCFKRTIYFLRRDIAASYFFSKSYVHTELAEPLTGNTALLCALSLGFREVYLFGLDFGARTPEIHHSRHSVDFSYNGSLSTPEVKYAEFGFETLVPGNFGGKIKNGWLLEFSRIRANAAIEYFEDANVRNCSDGARIPAANALDHRSLNISPTPTTHEEEIEAALEHFLHCEEPLVKKEQIKEYNKNCQNFINACINIIQNVSSRTDISPKSVHLMCEQIVEELSLHVDSNPEVHSLLKGDIQTILATVHFYISVCDLSKNKDIYANICSSLEIFFVELGKLVNIKMTSIIKTIN